MNTKLFKLFKLDVSLNCFNGIKRICTFENVSSSILGGVVYVLRFFLDTLFGNLVDTSAFYPNVWLFNMAYDTTTWS